MEPVRIDDEFAQLCPPLSDGEVSILRESIGESGLRDPLCLWQGILIDGHNRYRICTELQRPYHCVSIELPDRNAVKEWILRNQLGRRNLGFLQASYLRGKYYEAVKRERDAGCGDGNGLTIDRLGKMFGVCGSTIKHDAWVARSIEMLCPRARAYTLSADVCLKKQHVWDLAALSHPSQEAIIDRIEAGQFNTLGKAILKLRPAVDRRNCNKASRRCKGCGSRLAPGVETCLKCDLTHSQVLTKLDSSENSTATDDESVLPHGWQDRLEHMRSLKATRNDNIRYYVERVTEYVETFSATDDSWLKEEMLRLRDALNDRLSERRLLAS